jgi:hypothetical protein
MHRSGHRYWIWVNFVQNDTSEIWMIPEYTQPLYKSINVLCGGANLLKTVFHNQATHKFHVLYLYIYVKAQNSYIWRQKFEFCSRSFRINHKEHCHQFRSTTIFNPKLSGILWRKSIKMIFFIKLYLKRSNSFGHSTFWNGKIFLNQ